MTTTAMMTVKAIFLLWSISCGSILAFSPSLHFIRHEKSVFVSGRSGATGTLLRASSIASTSFGGSTTTTTTSTTNTNTPFWSEGLNFTCSACGKCCQNKGEVWFNTEEFTHLVEKIQLPVQDVLDFYVEEVQSGWVKLKSKEADGLEECIFLSNTDHKSCTIYEQRPVQCRTYPYWSRLLGERKEWIAERVEPEEREGRHWSLEEGGCEGIEPEHIPKTLVPPRTIYMNRELYEQYSESFPFMTNGQDVDRLKTTTAMMQV